MLQVSPVTLTGSLTDAARGTRHTTIPRYQDAPLARLSLIMDRRIRASRKRKRLGLDNVGGGRSFGRMT